MASFGSVRYGYGPPSMFGSNKRQTNPLMEGLDQRLQNAQQYATAIEGATATPADQRMGTWIAPGLQSTWNTVAQGGQTFPAYQNDVQEAGRAAGNILGQGQAQAGRMGNAAAEQYGAQARAASTLQQGIGMANEKRADREFQGAQAAMGQAGQLFPLTWDEYMQGQQAHGGLIRQGLTAQPQVRPFMVQYDPWRR